MITIAHKYMCNESQTFIKEKHLLGLQQPITFIIIVIII